MLMTYSGDVLSVALATVGAPLHLVLVDLAASKDTVVILEQLQVRARALGGGGSCRSCCCRLPQLLLQAQQRWQLSQQAQQRVAHGVAAAAAAACASVLDPAAASKGRF